MGHNLAAMFLSIGGFGTSEQEGRGRFHTSEAEPLKAFFPTESKSEMGARIRQTLKSKG